MCVLLDVMRCDAYNSNSSLISFLPKMIPNTISILSTHPELSPATPRSSALRPLIRAATTLTFCTASTCYLLCPGAPSPHQSSYSTLCTASASCSVQCAKLACTASSMDMQPGKACAMDWYIGRATKLKNCAAGSVSVIDERRPDYPQLFMGNSPPMTSFPPQR